MSKIERLRIAGNKVLSSLPTNVIHQASWIDCKGLDHQVQTLHFTDIVTGLQEQYSSALVTRRLVQSQPLNPINHYAHPALPRISTSDPSSHPHGPPPSSFPTPKKAHSSTPPLTNHPSCPSPPAAALPVPPTTLSAAFPRSITSTSPAVAAARSSVSYAKTPGSPTTMSATLSRNTRSSRRLKSRS